MHVVSAPLVVVLFPVVLLDDLVVDFAGGVQAVVTVSRPVGGILSSA
jgi:hypothetical protein